MSAKPRVALIILNWNGLEDTLACLKSTEAISYAPLEVVVVDNGSEDGSVEAIRRQFPMVRLIAHPVNTGFAEGNNIGIRAVLDTADYVLLLNNDTTVSSHLPEILVAAMEKDERIAVSGPAICYADAPRTLWCAGLAIGKGRLFGLSIENTTSSLMYCGAPVEALPAAPYDVDAVVGCAMLLRVSAIRETGLLDASLFMIHEDFDWSLRAQKNGYRCVVVPEVGVWHRVSASINLQDRKRRGNPAGQYYWYRNWLIVVRKHFGRGAMLKVAVLYAFRLFPALFLTDLIKRRYTPSVWMAYGLSLVDALTDKRNRRFVRQVPA
ncbi:MAG: glycosyltransferase family 2 protein [candidate division Zixibacteria bacterium]|nr:glycosyltransferase family 2 protein [candidate division Zixibacteria bacterium]